MGVLKTVATFGLVGSNNSGGNNNTPIISLNIVRGSVVDFTAPTSDKAHKRIGAIVNAANERCLGGDVGFSLLSAGIFRGNRSQEDVLRIGIIAIRDYIIDIDATNTLDYGDCVTIPDDPKKEKEGEKETGSEPSQEEKKEQCENKDVDGISKNIASAAYSHKLKTITLCGFTREEINLLLKICNEIFNNNDSNSNNNNVEDNEKNNNDDDKNEKNPSK
ncbi:hypothetical protein FRACYDRAFT_271430 [Fragilariopsis cylindrus CCMP1102]|uniref:Macro domain-containing protein n=1 Tax=Fragilariopsis cylindrus CCMP1102 TaxID=635003 RepID=A0A1E7ETQ9_9STRA|nr:hypothetical protein FRACYDRAFT_271430 [Fragilariopsis cylindrus CCMP1102]|eukprot:OEU09236.1 hypothetical protein FRACYDRAFT_271430 [Fragilariopsis cylindrus CCMP1102]